MKNSFSPLQLFAEVIGIVGLAEVLVMLVLPLLTPGLTGLAEGLTDVTLLVLLSGPLVYWRCLAALARARTPSFSGATGGTRTMRNLSARTAISLAIGTQLVGLALTTAGVLWQKNNLDQIAQDRFERGAERIELEVKRRFAQPLLGLKGARGAYAARDGFNRRAFRAYVESRDLATEFPGVRGFGYMERVQRANLAEFMDAERADGAPDFVVKTSGNAPDLFVIKYIEPLADNRAAWGFDVGQEAVRREAIERAVVSGQPALTGRITLVQDGTQRPGFLYLLPVYRHGTQAFQPDLRPSELVGLLYSPFVAADLLRDVAAGAERGLDFELFEGDGTQAAQLVFDADAQLRTLDNPAVGPQDVLPWKSVRRLAIGGRNLTLRISSTPAFASGQDRSSLAIAGVGGALASAIMALAVWLLAVGRLRAQRLAEGMTADLDRMARVVQHTDNAVSIADAQCRITWVNAGFTRLTGYTLEDALGKTPGELLGSGKADPETLQTLLDAATRGLPCRVEILNRAKDGHEYWTDTEVQPTHDAHGILVGFMEIGTDISVQKRTRQRLEAAIRDTSALLSTLEMHTITSSADRDGNITEVNDAFCETSGYRREELIGQNHRIVNSDVHPPAFWEDMWETISRGDSWRGDICNRSKDGRLYWVDSMIAPFIGDDGKVEKYVSIRTDITVNKADQLRMADMADRLALAIEGGSDGLWDWIDVNTSAQWWSPSYYSLIGYSAEELPASLESFNAILHPDHVERCRTASERAIHGRKDYDEEHLLRTKSHGYRWFRSRAKVYRNAEGQAVRMAGSTQDIHDRKLAQASVVKTSQRFALAADSAKIGVWEWDLPTNTLSWDTQMFSLYQRTPSVVVTPLVALEEGLHPDDKARFEAAVQATIRHDTPFEGDYRIIWPNGEVRHIRAAARAVRDADGLAIRLTGVNFDITEVKRSEDVLSHAVAAAEEASRSKSQFLANMSHEIRTPMNAILGMLKLLQNTELTVRQSDYAAKTEGAARSLLGLLNDILDFSKVEAGKMTLDPRVFRVDHLLRDLSVILSANVGSKDIEVLFDIDPTLPPMLVGDDMRLQQVLINLGGNAIKFTSTGEVVLGLQVVDRGDAEVRVRFTMKDSGIGIAPENQAHIFSGFSQAEASTTRRFGGTGLGLAISSRLVSLLGGSLQLESALGQGSTFYFELRFPVAPALLPASTGRDLQSLGAMPTLIVDDNDQTRTLLGNMARSLGWQVDTVASGAAALASIDARAAAGQPPYAAIFMDWHMPGMDGWEACRRIRARTDDAAATMVVMVTANGRELLSQRSAHEQTLLDGFLVKPVTSAMLRDAVLDAKGAARTAEGGHNPQPPQAVLKPKRLQGLRLLVVEDNKINQMVAQGLLVAEGAEVTLADDGQLGVEAVLRTVPAFDVVLMDLQMPVMDGFEATRAIRQQLGMTALPIIAMTANAMASDRAACLAAGMNDHVGKPFELDHLVSVLLQYSGHQSQAAPTAVVSVTPATRVSDYPPGDLDVSGALVRLGGDTRMLAMVLQTFAADMVQVPTQLAQHLQAAQREEGLRVLHTLKGLAATVGARHLAGVAVQLEARLKSADTAGDYGQLLQPLQGAIDATAQALVPVLAQYAPAVPDPVTRPSAASDGPPSLAQDLQILAGMLAQSDMQALEVFAHIRQAHGGGLGAALEPLEEAMAGLEFEAALLHCQALQQELA